MAGKPEVHLVAFVPDGSEPLGLLYLREVLQDGCAVRIHTFLDPDGLDRAAREIACADPLLVGVSMPSGEAALHSLAFVRRLRMLGYRGHVTCGGPWATLCRSRLLRSTDGVDSVVRHEGEAALLALVQSLVAGRATGTVPGVTTREGDGPTAPEETGAFTRAAPSRDVFRKYAGVPAAKVAATRGCSHRCIYCGLAAFHGSRGRSTIQRRSVEHVADEMASLYHDGGVRFFHFVDENHLPDDEHEAVTVLGRLDEELSRRRVGRRAVSMMLRADVATSRVVEAMSRLGVVRSLLGVESMTRASLSALGRGARPDVNVPAMSLLARHGIAFHFNILLLHPGSTMRQIRQDVAALQRVRAGLLDPFQVEAYEGTRLFERLERQGRLQGGPFVWHYALEDPAAERYAQQFRLLKTRVLARIPLTAFAYDVTGSLAVASHLGLVRRSGRRLKRDAARLVERHNAFMVRTLERMVEVASCGALEREAFLDESTEQAARLTLRFESLKDAVEDACARPLRCDLALPRTAAAAAIALSILGGGCSHTRIKGETTPDDVVEVVDGDEVATDVPADACSPMEAEEELNAAISTGRAAGCEDICELGSERFRFLLDADGRVVDVELSGGGPVPDELKSCYIDALAEQTFPCLAENPVWEWCYVLLA